MIYKMPLEGKWHVWNDTDLARWGAGTVEERDYADSLMSWYDVYNRNRAAFFLAHGQGTDFLNDLEHTVVGMRAPNQYGKTYLLLEWILLHSMDCDPAWPCFTQNGIKWRKVNPTGRAGIGSFMWLHMRRNIWPKLQELAPVDLLREYSPLWHPKDTRVRIKEPSWLHNPCVPLANGLTWDFYAYGQPGSAAESCTYQFWAFDEQVRLSFFDGAFARGTGVDDFRVAIAYTPVKIDGWAESGSGTWLHKLDNGTETRGLNFKVYFSGMKDVPDAIISAEKKKEYHHKYIIAPKKTGNLKALRSGRSRWFGEYEAGEGLVYDNWIPWVHLIDEFPIPPEWPRVRSVDPGRVEPFAGLRVAISPWNDFILYGTYYESGLGLEENVKKLIEFCGNRREKVDCIRDMDGNARVIWREQFTNERYLFTTIDPRTYATDSDRDGLKIGQVIADMGLDCIPGSGMHNERAVVLVKELLEIKKDRTHILVRMKIKDKITDKEGMELHGAPKWYVFNNPSNTAFVSEISGYVNRSVGDKEKPVDKDDHCMTAWKYMILADPHYVGPQKPVDEFKAARVNRFTGGSTHGLYVA